jgi:hypothetical protein
MIDDVVSFFENAEEVPSYYEICGAYVEMGEGFSEKMIVETELKLALTLDSKCVNKKDYHWDRIKSRWMERWL